MTTRDVFLTALAIMGLPLCLMAAHVAWGHENQPLLGFGWVVLAVVFAGLLALMILGVKP